MTNRFILSVFMSNLLISICANALMNPNDYGDTKANVKFNLLDLLQRYTSENKENRRETTNDPFENWTGRWLPERAGDPAPPPKVVSQQNSIDSDHGEIQDSPNVGMESFDRCDDGKTNLTIDWDNSPVNYTCYDERITPEYAIKPLLYCEDVPKAYVAAHKCMHNRIQYDDDIPIYGSHRPVWPVYGEYRFVPKQRWLHSLEHGAVVMLYHPCANPSEVKRLKTLVTGCLRRHIITPYNLLDEDRPLALLTWGCRLTMSYVNPSVVHNFIEKRALRGPEHLSLDGGFEEGLMNKAEIVTDEDDTSLCPNI